ncbi:MAG: hypothetical protein IPP17_13970 [Bacteroidetes bacterium]|nr:hypothetical protein [Bacteroidota bacterium]
MKTNSSISFGLFGRGYHDLSLHGVNLGTGLSFSQQGTRYNEVDGWGVIMTPYDSIECLRVVSETDGVDSVSFNGFQFGIANVQRSIKFLANGVHIPILEITGRVQMGNFQPQRAKYRDEYRNLVATAEPRSTGIRFYPNPPKTSSPLKVNCRSHCCLR